MVLCAGHFRGGMAGMLRRLRRSLLDSLMPLMGGSLPDPGLLAGMGGMAGGLLRGGLDLFRADGRCAGGRAPYCVAGSLAPGHADQAALEKAACRCSGGVSAGTAPMSAHSAEGMAHRSGNRPHPFGGDHRLRQHGAAGVAHIDAQAGHKAVDLLGRFEKADGAQKPDQHVPGHGFTADGIYLRLHIRLTDRGGRQREGHRKNYCKHKDACKSNALFRCHSPCQIESGLERKAPTMLTKSRRHHAFIKKRKIWPPNIRHQLLKILEVAWEDPIANATGAV